MILLPFCRHMLRMHLPSACLHLDSTVWLPPYAAPCGRGACFFRPHAYSSISPFHGFISLWGCRHMLQVRTLSADKPATAFCSAAHAD